MGKVKKPKTKKLNRNETAVNQMRIQKVKEVAFGKQIAVTNKKNDYIKNLINGRYYLARCNMLAVQIQKGEIKESIDGCLKSEEYMRSEYALMKMQAITSMRSSHFAKKYLIEDFKLTFEEVEAIEYLYDYMEDLSNKLLKSSGFYRFKYFICK